MSCDKCDQYEADGMIAYYRWGKANVGLVGCDVHVREVINALNEIQEGRTLEEDIELIWGKRGMEVIKETVTPSENNTTTWTITAKHV